MDIHLVYMTAANREEAGTIGRELVTARLAACVNIVDNMNSLYWWEGEIQEDTEAILIAKTTETMLPALIEKVKLMHSYDCPCIVSLPVSGGNSAFLEWIAAEVNR